MVRRQAQHDIHRIIAACRAVFRQFQPRGDHLHHRPNRPWRGPIARRLATIHAQLPVDAGQGQAVRHVNHIRYRRDPARQIGRQIVQTSRIIRRKAQLNGFSGWRAGLGHRNLDIHAGNTDHGRAQIVEDLIGVLALAPVDEFILNDANRIGRTFVSGPTPGTNTGVDGFYPWPAQDPRLGQLHQCILFMDRQVAARLDIQQPILRFDVGEELYPLADLAIDHRNGDQAANSQHQHDPGVANGPGHQRHIGPILLARRFLERTGNQRAQNRHKDQRVKHAGRERRDQGDRHEFHELAHHAGPEQQRREGGDPRHGRGSDRSSHLAAGLKEGGLAILTFRHATFGIFHDDDRVINQHADRKDQAEQDHKVDRQTRHLQPQNPHQKTCRNGQPDEDGRAHGQGIENDDEDQNHGRQDRILQVGQKLANGDRLVLAEGHLDPFGQVLGHGVGHRAHRVHRFDQIGANAF